MPEHVGGDHGELVGQRRDQRRPGLVAAGDPVQEQERWPLARPQEAHVVAVQRDPLGLHPVDRTAESLAFVAHLVGRVALLETALITGASGFIGRTMTARLRSQGVSVRGVDILADGEGGIVAGDVGVAGAWQDAAAGCDTVIHTAAIVSNAASAADAWRINVLGTRNALDAAVRAGSKRFVHFSSVRAFGDVGFPDRVEERHPVRPDGHTYVDTKIASEQVVLQAHAAGEIECTVIRPGDVYGPGSRPWTILPVEAIAAGRFFLPAMGRGIHSPVYVDDLVDGVLLAARVAARPAAACSRSPAGSGSPATSSSATTRGCSAGPLPVACRRRSRWRWRRFPRRRPGSGAGRPSCGARRFARHDPHRHLLDREGPPDPRLRAGGRPGRGHAPDRGVAAEARGCWSGAESGEPGYQCIPRIRYANASCWLFACSSVVAPRDAPAVASAFGFSPFAAVESGNMW